ncbi:MAG TPA: DUF1707 domain-containing protein [Streptosporangiaceae bacterium]|jgi:hypothetical protein
MTIDGGIRASDDDRERTVEVLREAYAAGRLDLDEFDERTSTAYSAKTWDGLRELTSDLPAQPRLGADLAEPEPDAPKPEAVDAGLQFGPRRPFVPILPIALVWLAIAAAAHATAAVIPLVLLSLFVLRAAGWRRRPPERPSPGTATEPSRRADDAA